MKSLRRMLMLAGALCASLAASAASAADNKVVIGDIDDMSGPYADVIGAAGVEAIKMAIADFGGTVLGQPIEVLTFDHQNKPALGAEKLREWADTQGMTMLLGGSNTGVSIAMSAAAKEKKVPFIAIGAAGASLTGKDCTPYTIHYGYDTTALANGTAKTILEQGGKSWFFITADYAFGKQLEAGATEVVKAGGGSVKGDVRVPLATSDFSSYLLQAQGSGAQVLGLANAGADTQNSLKAAAEFGLTKTMRPAALLVFLTDVHAIGLQTAQGLVLTTAWYWNMDDTTRDVRQSVLRKDEGDADLLPGRLLFGDARLSQRGQGGRVHRFRQGHGAAPQDEDQRHVRQGRRDPPRRPARARHVHRSGQDAGRIEGRLGLLQDPQDDEGRGGVRQARGFRLPPGQEIEEA